MQVVAFRSGQYVIINDGDLIFPNDFVQYCGRWLRADQHPEYRNLFPAAPPPAPAARADGAPGWLVGLGVIATGFLAVWGIRRLTEDPEPRRIRELAEGLERAGATVFADVKGWARPPLLNGRIPDVYAIHNDGFETAIEVENERGFDRSHARGQADDLGRWAARSYRRSFEVVVVDGGRGGRS